MHKKHEIWCKNGGSRGSWGAFDEFLKKMGEDGVKLASPLPFLSFFVRPCSPRRVEFIFFENFLLFILLF